MGILSFFRYLFGGMFRSKAATAPKTRTKPTPADEVAEITARTRQQIKSTSTRHAAKKTVDVREEEQNETVARPKPKKRKQTPPRKTDTPIKLDAPTTPVDAKPKPRKRKPKPRNPSDDTASGS